MPHEIMTSIIFIASEEYFRKLQVTLLIAQVLRKRETKKVLIKLHDFGHLSTVEGLPFLDFKEEFDWKKCMVLGPKLLHMKLKVVINISLKWFPIVFEKI